MNRSPPHGAQPPCSSHSATASPAFCLWPSPSCLTRPLPPYRETPARAGRRTRPAGSVSWPPPRPALACATYPGSQEWAPGPGCCTAAPRRPLRCVGGWAGVLAFPEHDRKGAGLTSHPDRPSGHCSPPPLGRPEAPQIAAGSGSCLLFDDQRAPPPPQTHSSGATDACAAAVHPCGAGTLAPGHKFQSLAWGNGGGRGGGGAGRGGRAFPKPQRSGSRGGHMRVRCVWWP